MKLASVKNNTRDGQLLIVSKDLSRAVIAGSNAPTMQFAIDNWNDLADELQQDYERLNNNELSDAF